MNPTLDQQLGLLKPVMSFNSYGEFTNPREFSNASGKFRNQMQRRQNKINNIRRELDAIDIYLETGNRKPLREWAKKEGMRLHRYTAINGMEYDDIGVYDNADGDVDDYYDELLEYHDYLEDKYDDLEEQYDGEEEEFDNVNGGTEEYLYGRGKRRGRRKKRREKRKKKKVEKKAQRAIKKAEKKAEKKQRKEDKKTRKEARKEFRKEKKAAKKAWKASGKPGGRKGLRGTRKKLRKEKRATIKKAGGNVFKRGLMFANRGAMLVPRGAFAVLLRLNVWDMAKKIAVLEEKSKTDARAKKAWIKLTNAWKLFGGKVYGLKFNASRGKNKKPLIIKFRKKKGFTGEDTWDVYIDEGNGGYFSLTGAEEATAAAVSSTPIIVTISTILSSVVAVIGALGMDKKDKKAITEMAEEQVEKNPDLTEEEKEALLALQTGDINTKEMIMNDPNLTPEEKASLVAEIEEAEKAEGMATIYKVGIGVGASVLVVGALIFGVRAITRKKAG